MENKDAFYKTLSILREKPRFLLMKPDFNSLKYFLEGYLHCLSEQSNIPFNMEFSKWLPKEDGTRSPLIWSEYILLFRAGGDEEKAYNITIEEIKKFIDSFDGSPKESQ